MAPAPRNPSHLYPFTPGVASVVGRGDSAALGIRVGTTLRALRERAVALLRDRPLAAFADFPAVLDALLPEDDDAELDIALAAGTTVGELWALQSGLGGGVAGVEPEVLVRLARFVTLDLDALRALVRRDASVAHDGARVRTLEEAITRAWEAVPR